MQSQNRRPFNYNLSNHIPRSTLSEFYSDSRKHGYQGPTRNVRMHRATPNGGGAIAKSEDGTKCVVAGKESLRLLHMTDPSQITSSDHKSSIGRGGHKIDSSRNFWDSNILKIDCASTDVAWGHGSFDRKILTSARNGDLIMWDIDKSGSKFERRTRDHVRSIQKLSYSRIAHYYCITGSADGDVRIWDLRDMSRSIMKIHHPTSIRSVVFSPSLSSPLQAVVGLDNGSIYRWDLKMGQRGQLDRIPIAHSGSILTLDWCNVASPTEIPSGPEGTPSVEGGWIVSGGLDHTVKIWDLAGSNSHIPHKPTYTLHPSFPVRCVIWRPGYPCELALVSNADLGSGSNTDLLHNIGASGPSSPRLPSAELAMRSVNESKATCDNKKVTGDAVEIWDARRGWIAKWTVEASTLDGAVTDIVFRDSHCIWAQHTSGTFAQVDLRHSMKPIDAIPRTSLSWDVSGSLAFVSDRKTRCEIPYDDFNPDKQQLVQDRKIKAKRLGDKPCKPTAQSLGTYSSSHGIQEIEILSKLARGYVFEGADRQSICTVNAGIAMRAGRLQASQVWLLLGSLLTDIVPENHCGAPEPTPPINLPLIHSTSAPAALPTVSSGISISSAKRATSSDSVINLSGPASKHDAEPDPAPKPPANSRNLTPASSASSSPRRPPSVLPATPRQPTGFPSNAVLARRPSIFSPRPCPPSNASGETTTESVRSHSSLRHVGEGALDDSDSETDDPDDNDEESDEETSLQPLVSPYIKPRIVPPHPSPLSRIAGQQQWSADEGENDREDEEGSPSPGSTDTESSGSSNARSQVRKPSTSRRSSSHVKTRSRSSTVASLAAPSLHRRLIKQESQSTIRTLTAGDASIRDQELDDDLPREDTARDVQSIRSVDKPLLSSHKRKISRVFSGDSVFPSRDHGDEERMLAPKHKGSKPVDQRRKDLVQEEEAKLREIGWQALRDAFEQYANEGDVQMCAMLSLVAGQELLLRRSRTMRFLESYADTLTRLRLDTSAAYLRKFCSLDDVRDMTKLETTIYTACGKCRKAILMVASQQNDPSKKGLYSLCQSCRTTFKCSICHLPVRALLFQCSICAHGGHQECYRRYYMGRPLSDVKGFFSTEAIARSTTRASPSLSGDTERGASTTDVQGAWSTMSSFASAQVMGHLCAAGCGHHCWAVARNDGSEL